MIKNWCYCTGFDLRKIGFTPILTKNQSQYTIPLYNRAGKAMSGVVWQTSEQIQNHDRCQC